MSSINSPFRYAGGKFYARKLILDHLTDHTSYIEPFAGGASIFFAKGKVSLNWLNDIDHGLINVYSVIRDCPNDLIEFLTRRPLEKSRVPVKLVNQVALGDMLPASKELHRFFKMEFQPKDGLEKAGRWFYLNRTSYSGIMNDGNTCFGIRQLFRQSACLLNGVILRTSEKLQ